MESVEFPIKIRFRGQYIFRETENEIIYLNSPWLKDLDDLRFHNLLVSDFALHDTITDNLQLLQSKQIVNEDMKKIANELIIQRNELIEKNDTIIELARFPDQNPLPILRIDFEGNILYNNEPAYWLIKERSLLKLHFWETVCLRFESNGFQNFESDFSLDQSIYHATLVPVKNRNYFNAYLKETTEMVRFQQELVNTSSRLQTLISSMHSGILAENTNRQIILTNQIFCDIFKIPLDPDSMRGMDCSDAAQNSKHLFEDEAGFVARIDKLLLDRKRIDG